jgi:D-amino-acid dehydrogenase
MLTTPSPASAASSRTSRVMVLGGGIVGVTTAYYLLKSGFEVTIVERAATVGELTSKGNAGLVSAGCSQPWNAPGVPLTVLKNWGRSDSPYLFRLSAFPGIIPWATRFLLHCKGDLYRRSCRSSAELLSYSLGLYKGVVEAEGLKFDRQSKGVLKYFEDGNALKRDTLSTAVLAEVGLEYKVLDARQIVELEPALAPHRTRIAGGIFFPNDESGDSSLFAKALLERCVQLGATVLTNTEISDIVARDGEVQHIVTSRGNLTADSYVICLGPSAAPLAARAGVKLPIYPVKGYSVTIDTDGTVPLPSIAFLDWGRKIAVTPFGNRIRAAGTAEFCGYNLDPTPARFAALRKNLIELFPALDGMPSTTNWTGHRPVTPDGMPVIGPSPIGNLFLNAGHGPQGWGLSCGCAAILADVMRGKQPDVPLDAFSYARL